MDYNGGWSVSLRNQSHFEKMATDNSGSESDNDKKPDIEQLNNTEKDDDKKIAKKKSSEKKKKRRHSRSKGSSRGSRSRSRSRDRRRKRGRRSRSMSRSTYSRSPSPGEKRLHIADLDDTVRRRDVEETFAKYGKLSDLWVATYPPFYAFVVFERSDDARQALKAMKHGYIRNCPIRTSIALPRGNLRSVPHRSTRRSRSRTRSRSPKKASRRKKRSSSSSSN